MATTSIWDVKDNLRRVINYAINPDKTTNIEFEKNSPNDLNNVLEYAMDDLKTEKQFYVSGINVEPENAYEEMMITKKQYQKEGGILVFHGYQSFAPGEVTAETAHKIGVEMAKELWGSRFEVVVSTHLDKLHFHNHFVINSVSFKDGLRYYDNKANYKKMRLTSDRLCKKYALSVIENPSKKSWHYAEWQADKNHKPTWRSLIRDDVDEAIRQSMTFSQFLANIKKAGYEVKTGVKHIAVRPPGKERYIRLRSLSQDNRYDEEHIKERILEQRGVKMMSVQAAPIIKVYKYHGDLNQAKKITGFRALYFRYLYLMGILPKNRAPRKRVHFLLKEELLHMEQITNETTLLCKKKITTLEQLEDHEMIAQKKLDKLLKERRCIYNKVRRCRSEETKQLLQKDIAALSFEIKSLRKEVMLYEGIKQRSVKMKDVLQQISKEQEREKCEQWRNSGSGNPHDLTRD